MSQNSFLKSRIMAAVPMQRAISNQYRLSSLVSDLVDSRGRLWQSGELHSHVSLTLAQRLRASIVNSGLSVLFALA